MKRISAAIVLCSFISCNTQSSIEKTVDSTSAVVDSQKYATKDSVSIKSDSSKKVIDSSFQKLKDSLKKTK